MGRDPFACDYDKNCIELYKRIEAKEWDDVIHFLDHGRWPGFSLLPDYSPKLQSMTVVTKFEHKYGQPECVRWSRLPLQRACMLQPPFGVVRRLVEIYPQAVRWANNHGQLALHLALLFGASDDIVAFLVRIYPDTINKETMLGYTPLQAALKAENNVRGIILAAFVEYSNSQLDPCNNYVLQYKPTLPSKVYNCDYHQPNCIELYKRIEARDWESIDAWLRSGHWPFSALFGSWGGPDKITPKQQVRTWVTRRDPENGKTLYSRLPLHFAIVCGAPFSITSRLIELYPQAVRYPDDEDMLPIHLALLHNADDDLAAKLLLDHPQAVNQKSLLGLTPLECALRAKDNVRGKIIEVFVIKSEIRTEPDPDSRKTPRVNNMARCKRVQRKSRPRHRRGAEQGHLAVESRLSIS